MNDRSGDPASSVTISGSPSEEEVAAIMAATEAARPKPAPSGWAQRNTSWRFSGRWWSRPIPLRRARPLR